MPMFSKITIRDFSRPVRERHSKGVGPYYWQPTEPGKGRGFYSQSTGKKSRDGGPVIMTDSVIDLRVELARDILREAGHSRTADTFGYYTDACCDSTMYPIVARLPHSRGFLIGWTMGPGMCGSLEPTLYSDAEDAARAAYSHAQHCAEEEREYQEAWQAGSAYLNLGEEIARVRRNALTLAAEYRKLARTIAPSDAPAVCKLLRDAISGAWDTICKLREEREEERHKPWNNRTRAAFNEGASEKVFTI